MADNNLLDIIENLEDELIKVYRKLHEYPELSNEEFKTTDMIKKLLTEVDINVIDLNIKTGLVAEIKGNPKGPVIAMRCDIDALPINEETELEYKSRINGKMHACGHDFHTAVMLGAAYLIKRYQKALIGTVKLIFQAGEESADGAKNILSTGVLDDVDVIFGIHSIPDADVGVLGIKERAVTAAVDRFEINIQGVGSHAARPEKSVDPIVIATNVIVALQTIVSRNINPRDKALLSVTHIESGNTWNVIPESAYIEGTVRTLDEKVRVLIPRRINEIVKGIAEAFDGKAELLWHSGSPATNNDEEWSAFCADLGKRMGYKIKRTSMGLEGEDFAYYQKKIKGVFITVGTGLSHAHHHPEFMIDERALLPCARYLSRLAESALKHIIDLNN
ncbi:MAG: amidohydrolase [Clostridium sp.]|nr:amidohydrolase [Clostridium sp.]